jgi:hypothetical protein
MLDYVIKLQQFHTEVYSCRITSELDRIKGVLFVQLAAPPSKCLRQDEVLDVLMLLTYDVRELVVVCLS